MASKDGAHWQAWFGKSQQTAQSGMKLCSWDHHSFDLRFHDFKGDLGEMLAYQERPTPDKAATGVPVFKSLVRLEVDALPLISGILWK